MKTSVPTDINHSSKLSNQFHQFAGGFVLSGLPCIITDSKTVYFNDIYLLIDFGDNGGITEHAVRFFDASLRGYVVTIVLLDLKSGELIKCSHRINIDALPCNWVLTDTDIFEPKRKEGKLLDFCF